MDRNFENILRNDFIRKVQNDRDALIKAAMIKKGFDLPIEEYINRGRILELADVKTFFIDDTPICSFTELEPEINFTSSDSSDHVVKITQEYKFQEL